MISRHALAAGALAIFALASAAPATGESTSRAADDRSFRLVVVTPAAKAPPQIFTVRKGEAVRIALSSDAPIDFHLHGYALSAKTAPDRPAEFRFMAHATGRFPIHVHRAGEDGAHRHALPAAYLDVRPR
ncbi:MAG: hypothetical protein AB7G15_05830 [Alphaproteobacteria bacterium]